MSVSICHQTSLAPPVSVTLNLDKSICLCIKSPPTHRQNVERTGSVKKQTPRREEHHGRQWGARAGLVLTQWAGGWLDRKAVRTPRTKGSQQGDYLALFSDIVEGRSFPPRVPSHGDSLNTGGTQWPKLHRRLQHICYVTRSRTHPGLHTPLPINAPAKQNSVTRVNKNVLLVLIKVRQPAFS